MEYHCKYDSLVQPVELRDHPRNVNRHPRIQLDALVNFIRFSGWRHPVVVSNLSGFIVAGHARKMAAIELGCDCPVVYQDFESEAAERTFLHADNKLAELSNLDMPALDIEVLDLKSLDIPIEDFGFDILSTPAKEPEIKPVDDDGYGYFLVTAEDHCLERLIEALTSIDGVLWERKK